MEESLSFNGNFNKDSYIRYCKKTEVKECFLNNNSCIQ